MLISGSCDSLTTGHLTRGGLGCGDSGVWIGSFLGTEILIQDLMQSQVCRRSDYSMMDLGKFELFVTTVLKEPLSAGFWSIITLAPPVLSDSRAC